MKVNIERTVHSEKTTKPVDSLITIASTHSQLEPGVRLSSNDLSLAVQHKVCRRTNFVLDLVSYTTPEGRIRWRVLKSGADAVLKRNGFIYADADVVLDRFEDNPDSGFLNYVLDFMRRYVGYLNGDVFVVKAIDDSGQLISVSGECYGRRQAKLVARELGGEPVWFS